MIDLSKLSGETDQGIFDTRKVDVPELRPGIVHQIFVPITVPIGKEVAPVLVNAVNAASKQILPDMSKNYPGRTFTLQTRQVVVLEGKLQQNLLMLMDLIVD